MTPGPTVEIQVLLPAHLSQLARSAHHVTLDAVPTQRGIIDALEQRYPALRGTLRDASSGKRRPFVRFFAGEEDLSHDAPDDELPAAVADGREPFRIIGAMAGG